ncbi:MAG: 30S ribosomal protein S20 [Oscillospiraceae bacterium]|nr:30S ribosomal protein S20 [Oscillospiraceae bacterium]
MSNIKSSRKRVKVAQKKHKYNKTLISSLRTALRKSRAVDSDNSDKLLAIKALDKAVSKNILHKNNAARRKSKIAKSLSRPSNSV